MTNWDLYAERLNAYGYETKSGQIDFTKQSIINDFENNPSYENVLIDGVEFGVIIVDENALIRNPNKKRILMKPGDSISVGNMVTWDSHSWLCTDIDNNDIYIAGIIEQCNETLSVQTGQIETIVDYDSLGRPITEITPIIYSTPCIASAKLYINSYTNKDQQINLPYGQIVVRFPYNASYEVKPDMVFEMYGNKYRIFDTNKTNVIDGVGIVEIIAEKEGESG